MMPVNDDPAHKDKQPFRITLQDLENVNLAPPHVSAQTQSPAAVKSYGSIAATPATPSTRVERGSLFLQGWFYLGIAGLAGALIAWAICEPAFVDGNGARWGNTWIVPLIVTLMCIGFGMAESVVERSLRKALLRGALAVPLGVVMGFVFFFIAEIIYGMLVAMCRDLGVASDRNPAMWLARGIAWAVFGTAGGAIYGIVGQSLKKAKYGVLGGMIGACLGGMIFDPIATLAGGAGPSRALGFALVGAATGIAMGLVESMLKDRWLYVTTGPLAGKQFILYKNQTTLGSAQQADIYLFKDQSILPQHAVFEITGSRVNLRAHGATFIAGNPVYTRVLQEGDLLQIGRYAFRYREKHRA